MYKSRNLYAVSENTAVITCGSKIFFSTFNGEIPEIGLPKNVV